MKHVSIAILIILIQISLSKPFIANKIVTALNCGSNDQTVQSHDKLFKYSPDKNFVSGKSVDVDYNTNDDAKSADIKFTFDKDIYLYERHTYEQMTYSLPVRKGKNTLILKFAEMYFKNAGERVFDIKIGQRTVIPNMDVVARSGSKYAAHQQYIQIEVRPDGVYHEAMKIVGAIENDKIKLTFAKGKADNPIIQAIIVYADSVQNSPKAQYELVKKQWETQKEMQKAMKEEAHFKEVIAIQKKKEKVSIRNDQLVIEHQEEGQSAPAAAEKFGKIRSILMGPLGIIFWSIAFGYGVLFLHKNFFRMSDDLKKQ